MSQIISDIVIIRGAPGVGKSETAKALSKSFPSGVRLEIDTIRSMVINPKWTNQIEHTNLLDISTDLVLGFIRLGFRPVIIIDTFSGNKIDRFINHIEKSDLGLIVKIIGLFTTDFELQRRISLRENDQFKDFMVCKKINDETIKNKVNSEFQINTTEMTSESTSDLIIEHLKIETSG